MTTNITSIIVDCGHNDWTWIDGTNTAGTVVPAPPQYGQFPSTAPTTIPNPFTNTPGARYGAVGWTDQFGSNLYFFGGDGWELTGKSPADTLNGPMNDMWVCDMSSGDFCQWQLVGGYDSTPNGFSRRHDRWSGHNFRCPIRRPEHLLHKYWSSVAYAGTRWPCGRGDLDRYFRQLLDVWRFQWPIS